MSYLTSDQHEFDRCVDIVQRARKVYLVQKNRLRLGNFNKSQKSLLAIHGLIIGMILNFYDFRATLWQNFRQQFLTQATKLITTLTFVFICEK